MGATFSRLKNWNPEILTNEDLNAEIDNILNNLTPSGTDDFSSNLAQMQLQTDPGALGSESLATSLAGELERIRFVIRRLVGSDITYWYEAPSSTIFDLVSAVGSGLPSNRIVSGATTGNSSRLNALRANGAAASLQLLGNTTNFVYYIEGTQYTIDSDLSVTGLSTAPASNNTCTVDDTNLSGSEQYSEFLGQFGTKITVDAMGSEISNLIGNIAAFKTGTEYFIARVISSTELGLAFRGSFYDSSGDDIPAVKLTDNDTITLMRLAWIYANTSGALAVSYTNPTYSFDQPAGPSTGDYWFDLEESKWKTFNSTAWVDADATLIGWSVQDSSNCVATRTFDSFKNYTDLNTIEIEKSSATVMQAKNLYGRINVFGSLIDYGTTLPSWDITADLEAGYTEAASTWYYLYIDEEGQTIMSPVAPMLRGDLLGYYHPAESWRCVGAAFNSSGSDLGGFTPVEEIILQPAIPQGYAVSDSSGSWSDGSTSWSDVTNFELTVETLTGEVEIDLLPVLSASDFSFVGVVNNSAPSTQVTLSGYIRLLRDGATQVGLCIVSYSGAAISSGLVEHIIAPNMVKFYDQVEPGIYTYKIQTQEVSGSSTGTLVRIEDCVMRVRDVGRLPKR